MPTCLHPVIVHGRYFPCGKCPNCTQNKRNMLTSRFLLNSAFCGGITAFVTLTYDEEHLPRCQLEDKWHNMPCFKKSDVQKFIKRLRNEKINFQYFCSSEYGDISGRPHYHLLLWLFDSMELEQLRSIIDNKWQQGRTQTTRANDSRLSYACKYTLKEDSYLFQDLPNSHPIKPFRLFSSRPGIGTCAMDFINEYIYNGGNIRKGFFISERNVTFDTFIKRHIDPSLYEELKYLTYESNLEEIQQRLQQSYLSNSNLEDDGFGHQKRHYNYSKDNEIRKRHKTITNLKKSNKI